MSPRKWQSEARARVEADGHSPVGALDAEGAGAGVGLSGTLERSMARPSTRNLALPQPRPLERLSPSLATLDALLMREWEHRYYSFNKDWDPARGNRMGSMRNGCGDDFFILFTAAGAAIKGYAHECPMAAPGRPPAGVFEGFPPELEQFLDEPAFTMENTTFCLWCPAGGSWSIGPVAFPEGDDPDGSEFLMELLTGAPEDYQEYAREYFEVEVALDTVKSIYAHEPLTEALVESVNPETSVGELAADLAEIGYPIATG